MQGVEGVQGVYTPARLRAHARAHAHAPAPACPLHGLHTLHQPYPATFLARRPPARTDAHPAPRSRARSSLSSIRLKDTEEEVRPCRPSFGNNVSLTTAAALSLPTLGGGGPLEKLLETNALEVSFPTMPPPEFFRDTRYSLVAECSGAFLAYDPCRRVGFVLNLDTRIWNIIGPIAFPAFLASVLDMGYTVGESARAMRWFMACMPEFEHPNVVPFPGSAGY